jgi:hypothetical protein
MKSRFMRLVICGLGLALATAAITTAAQLECTGGYDQIRCIDGFLLRCNGTDGKGRPIQIDCNDQNLDSKCREAGHEGIAAGPLPKLVADTASTRAVLCPTGKLVASFTKPPVHIMNVCQIADISTLTDSIYSQGQLAQVCFAVNGPILLPTISDLGLVVLGTAILGLGLFRLRIRVAPNKETGLKHTT